jgi:hypothetical protein
MVTGECGGVTGEGELGDVVAGPALGLKVKFGSALTEPRGRWEPASGSGDFEDS